MEYLDMAVLEEAMMTNAAQNSNEPLPIPLEAAGQQLRATAT
jgi:hypothetical protein